jgi:hypothetical protein
MGIPMTIRGMNAWRTNAGMRQPDERRRKSSGSMGRECIDFDTILKHFSFTPRSTHVPPLPHFLFLNLFHGPFRLFHGHSCIASQVRDEGVASGNLA